MRASILSYFNGTPRAEQVKVLVDLERNWQNYDVFVIRAPVAFGKQKLGECIAEWSGNASFIVPTNVLSRQVKKTSRLNSLSKADLYKCDGYGEDLSCADRAKITKAKGCKKGFYCKGCPYVQDLQRVKSKRPDKGVYNYYTYLAHKIYRPTLIADEAHNLIKVIKDLNGHNLWHHEYKYPLFYRTRADLLKWLQKKHLDEKLSLLYQCLVSDRPTHILDKTSLLYERVKPAELRPVIRLLPIDVRNAAPLLWPHTVKKIVLMSATINEQDIRELGLDQRRVCYLDAESPIPAERRPIVESYAASVNVNNFPKATEQIAIRLLELAEKHRGEKGFVHSTYGQAKLLQKLLPNDRFVFHSALNTQDRLKQWFKSDPKDGLIFVGCGLYEGIDLKGDLASWQAIAKVPWPSLADPAIKHKAEKDPDWYVNQVIKDVSQAYGRVCRGPDDFGVTYVLDASFDRVLNNGWHLIPAWLKEVINLD
jgi:Rad3-related DNA helicase